MIVVATITSAVLAFGLGALWYSSFLLGPFWAQAVGKAPEELGSSARALALTFVVWLVAASAYSLIAHGVVTAPSLGELYTLAVAGWLAFAVPSLVMDTLFKGTAGALLWIDGGYQLVAMLLMAVTHAVLT